MLVTTAITYAEKSDETQPHRYLAISAGKVIATDTTPAQAIRSAGQTEPRTTPVLVLAPNEGSTN